MDIDIDILTLEELLEASRRADFLEATASRVSTRDMKPIDVELSSVSSFFKAAEALGAGFPSMEFKAVKDAPAPPEELKKYFPPAKQAATREQVELTVRGAKVDGHLVLSFASGKGRPKIWGLAPGSTRLEFARDMPLETASAFRGADAGEALARLEARTIAQATPQAPAGEGTPRI